MSAGYAGYLREAGACARPLVAVGAGQRTQLRVAARGLSDGTVVFVYCSLLCFTLDRRGTLLGVPHPACIHAVVAIRVVAEIAGRIARGARRGRVG